MKMGESHAQAGAAPVQRPGAENGRPRVPGCVSGRTQDVFVFNFFFFRIFDLFY